MKFYLGQFKGKTSSGLSMLGKMNDMNDVLLLKIVWGLLAKSVGQSA